MAKKFGGQFSPDGNTSERGENNTGAYEKVRVDPVGARSDMLFIPAIPMEFMSLYEGAVALIVALISAVMLTLAAWLLRGGLTTKAEYNARKVSRRPALTRKLISTVLTGLGIAFAAYRSEPGIVAPILYGLAVAGLHVAAFGIDPLRSGWVFGLLGYFINGKAIVLFSRNVT